MHTTTVMRIMTTLTITRMITAAIRTATIITTTTIPRLGAMRTGRSRRS